MAASIRYTVPYQVDIIGHDSQSGKRISNTLYYRSGQDAAPPAYGAAIPGPSDLVTFITNLDLAWTAVIGGVTNNISTHFTFDEYVVRAILGKQYGSPQYNIAAIIPGAPVVVVTTIPHGFSTGDSVSVSGVTTPTGVNGVWLITVITPTSFSLVGSTAGGAWSGDGRVQEATGLLEFVYGDKYIQTSIKTGLGSPEALPIFNTASVRRLNEGIGKSFRSRISMGPIPEASVQDGRFTGAALATYNTAVQTFFTTAIANGGNVANSQFMFSIAVSKKIAFGLSSPFSTFVGWTALVTGADVRPNNGSFLRRKPRLTAVIA